MKFFKLVTTLVIATFALNATAATVSGSSLQNGLDAITQGGSFLNVNDDQFGKNDDIDEVWQMGASGAGIATLVFEVASFAGTNTFGIYDILNPAIKLEIFNGADDAKEIEYFESAGSSNFKNVESNITVSFGSTAFGFYLDSSSEGTGGLFYSERALNTDVGDASHDGTTDHMVAYEGGTGLNLDIFGAGHAPFLANNYILAWEDLAFPGSDYDYSDMVVMVESVTPVPAPAVLALLGLGLLGIGAIRRRRVIA